MKKVITIGAFSIASILFACNTNNKAENEEGVSTEQEGVSEEYACDCPHKCKTTEECEKHCGPECMNSEE